MSSIKQGTVRLIFCNTSIIINARSLASLAPPDNHYSGSGRALSVANRSLPPWLIGVLLCWCRVGWVAGCPQRCGQRSCQPGPAARLVCHSALRWPLRRRLLATRKEEGGRSRKEHADAGVPDWLTQPKLSLLPRGAPTLPCCLSRIYPVQFLSTVRNIQTTPCSYHIIHNNN